MIEVKDEEGNVVDIYDENRVPEREWRESIESALLELMKQGGDRNVQISSDDVQVKKD